MERSDLKILIENSYGAYKFSKSGIGGVEVEEREQELSIRRPGEAAGGTLKAAGVAWLPW